MTFDLDQPLHGAPVAVFDLETTGSRHIDRICEIGIVLFESFFRAPPRVAYCTLVDPDLPGPWAGTNVHGIRPQDVGGAPSWASVWPEVFEMLSGCVVVAYNASFDLRFLKREADNICSTLPCPADERVLDPLRLVRRLDPAFEGKGYHSLSAACERRQIRPGTHRAADDAMAAAILLEKLVHELYRGKGKHLGAPPRPSVRQFIAWAAGEREVAP